MKLALIGTHGVGKTTLAYEICSLLKKAAHNVELVTEVAQRSPFPINEVTTLDGQLWILHAQIAKELDLDPDDAQRMTTLLREGVVLRKPEVTLSGEVECDEVYVVAGHKGHPEAVKKKGGLPDGAG